MKAAIAALGILLAWGAVTMSESADPPAADSKEATGNVLRHVVMFRFKPDAPPEQIRKVEQAFAELPNKIDVIADFEWGTNNSPEMHDKGFTHCFLVTFRNEAARAKYLPHPEHQKFVEVLKPVLDDVLVVDYWAAK